MTEAIWFTDALFRVHIAPESTGGTYAVMEGLMPPGHQPPPHIHEHEDEGFFVLEGAITLLVDGAEQVLHPGQAAHVPAGVEHTFRVTSSGPTRALCITTGGEFVGLVRAMGRPAERMTLPPVPVAFEVRA